MNGIINVYKEKGFTSFDVVAKMRGILKIKKIGHTGTLDPDAEGVLPVCIGNATRLCDMLTDKSKEYVAELRLGVITDTQDMSGTVRKISEVCCNEAQVREAVLSFVGPYEQIPPMYSALKVNGQKLCDLARQGKEVARAARSVQIFEIEIIKIELPVITMRVHCSKGTYIRTLCQDIGERLGCGGCMQSLIRTRVSRFSVEEAKTLTQIEVYRDAGRLEELLIPVDAMFEEYPAVSIEPGSAKLLDNGNPLLPAQTDMSEKIKAELEDGQKFRVYNRQNIFCGIFCYHEKEKKLKPERIFYIPPVR